MFTILQHSRIAAQAVCLYAVTERWLKVNPVTGTPSDNGLAFATV